MLPIADQTAGPIGLKFLWTLRGGRGSYRLKKKIFKFFYPRAMPGPLASYYYQLLLQIPLLSLYRNIWDLEIDSTLQDLIQDIDVRSCSIYSNKAWGLILH